MKTLNEIVKDQMELVQNDLQCILDGVDDEIIDQCCQVIVDRFNIVLERIDK